MTAETKEHIYSVSELTQSVKMLLEVKFPSVWVEGEISNLKVAGSGHIYFTLKDKQAQISVVFFRSKFERNAVELKDGLKARVLGNITVYERRGQYQLLARKIQPVGIGELQLAFEALKKKLYEKGLFDETHKKPTPMFPRRIGVVTSPVGAAIRDILNVLERRFFNLNIIINPVRVQGPEAAPEIEQAIKDFNRLHNVDVIIVTRGGGSLEDLWPFNEERVAYAIYESAIPVISAVGHEIDWTISDFVADLRVPTPSAAAELVVTAKAQFHEKIERIRMRLAESARRMLERYRGRIAVIKTHYIFQQPLNAVRQHQLRLDEFTNRCNNLISHRIELCRHKLEGLTKQLKTINPEAVLDRGYSLTISLKDGTTITDAATMKKGDRLKTQLKKGSFTSVAE